MATTQGVIRSGLSAMALIFLAGCDDFDIDLRPSELGNTSNAVQQVTAPRPEADARGVISYPGYQVAVARSGDDVTTVANRLGIDPRGLASHNGLTPDVQLRAGEILALPTRVQATDAEAIDIAALANSAIDRADGQNSAIEPVATSQTVEPIRHQVVRGETAFSISRLYNVSVRALADWNGLGPELEVREGQYLLIPVAAQAPGAITTTTLPGEGSVAPTPPSAQTPLPEPEAVVVESVASPELSQDRTSNARLSLPAQGSIIRAFERKTNEGIDIGAAAGAPVSAAADGTVAAITRDTDQVPILVLRHSGDLLTVYANIDNIAVEKGDTVTRGQKIAVVRSGSPSFLHFEVREGFESVDPLPYLN
ncbi:hypothetical protein ACMU_12600 [Actibacterium mucosum KCTC 23349]|uniref:LysM domain-containing protein n=1 Tax=Actibacterium mucosum KCTC 23349 TaxID=1454373 RepID=A0A037ZJ04_9RHOB|nr:M23 family metallopeptidase [Actibacterium mucosum]KAJ55527.1 hypothetical protein ACMU_12600 [Actibacterium mucosum KCTC 23349]